MREAVEEKLRLGKQGGLQRRGSHEGFLWADLGSWCLDKASDFPAWNVHSPRETANHRKGVRQKVGETDGEKEGGKGNRGRDRKYKDKTVEEKKRV